MKAWFCLRPESQILDLSSRVRELTGQPHVNRHPNLAFFGGAVIIAIMVIASFTNVANANGCPRDKSVEVDYVEADEKAEVEA